MHNGKTMAHAHLAATVTSHDAARWHGLWRLADPKISMASFAAIFLAAAAAGRDGALAWGWLAVTVWGVFAIEVAKNASGEIVDFRSGTDLAVASRDRSPFSGGKRVLVDRLLTVVETRFIALAGYGLAILAGLVIAGWHEPRVLMLGLAGLGAAFFYHAPPLRLAYRGWGEPAVAMTYGPLLMAGTYLVQRGHVTPALLLVSIPFGLLVAAFLVINEFPDYDADRQAGKRTWVVRLGRPRAVALYRAIVGLAFAVLTLLPFLGVPVAVLGGLLGLPASWKAARLLATAPESTPQLIPAQALSLLAFVLYSAGAGVGLLAV